MNSIYLPMKSLQKTVLRYSFVTKNALKPNLIINFSWISKYSRIKKYRKHVHAEMRSTLNSVSSFSYLIIIICQSKDTFLADNLIRNKPCPDSCNNMPLWSVFFYINGADRSTCGRLIPNWWSIIAINHIQLNVNISIKLRCASVRGTNSDSIALTL